MPVLCGLAEPPQGLLIILPDTQAVTVHRGKPVLRIGILLLSGFSEPLLRLGKILRHAIAVKIPFAHNALRCRVTVLRRPQEPLCGPLLIRRDSPPFLIDKGNVPLRI